MLSFLRRVLLAAALVLGVAAPSALGADLHATTANFASQFAAAASGDRVLLASGSYGTWTDSTAKSGVVTIEEETGATASFGAVEFTTAARNVTMRGVTYTGQTCIRPPTGVNMHVILDGGTWNDMGELGQASCGEGRVSVRGDTAGVASIDGNGVQIMNGSFGPGCGADGIQDLTQGTEIGPGNVFTGIVQNPCTAHADAIQPYASNYVHIHDNFFNGDEQGIDAPDGLTTGMLIENNVFLMDSHNYPCMHIGHASNSTIRHNVCHDSGIRVYGGNQGINSTNVTVQNNIDTGPDTSACTGCTIDHNLLVSQVTFTGGSGRCAYATQSPKGTASDGTDIGLNDCGGPPPPVQCNDGVDNDSDGFTDYPADVGCASATDTDETDAPVDNAPVARFTASPEPSAPAQTVTFDATTSTCQDTPCVYHWHDTGPPVGADCNQGGDWPVGSNGSTTTQAFSTAGTKCIELVLTDVDGDVSRVLHPHEVTTTPPPDTTAPDTTITSAPSNGTSTSASVSFTGTDNVGVTGFDCRIDAGAYSACTSPKSYTGLSVGSHTVDVRAKDAAGNVDATPASATWTVSAPDTTAPDTSITTAPTSGNATSASIPFTGTDNVGVDHFECKLDAGAYAVCTSPKAYSGLAVGSHTFSVRAFDAAANVDATPATATWSVTADVTAPDTSITTAPTSGTSTSASIPFTGTDNLGVDHFECKLDAAAYAVCTSPKAYSGLAVGSHTFSVRAFDAAGNVDASPATATWSVTSGTVVAPTFIAERETAWNTSTSPKAAASLTVQAGDVLVAYTMSEDNAQMTISGTNGLTWTSRATYAGVAGASAQATVWTSTVPAGTTSTVVTFTRSVAGSSGTQAHFGGNVLQFRGSAGVGVAGMCRTGGAGCSATPGLTLAGVSANSAIVKANVDWAAQSGASRASLTTGVGAFTEQTYVLDTGRYTVYGGFHPNAGAAGSKTIGYSVPTGETYTLLGVEVKGT